MRKMNNDLTKYSLCIELNIDNNYAMLKHFENRV